MVTENVDFLLPRLPRSSPGHQGCLPRTGITPAGREAIHLFIAHISAHPWQLVRTRTRRCRFENPVHRPPGLCLQSARLLLQPVQLCQLPLRHRPSRRSTWKEDCEGAARSNVLQGQSMYRAEAVSAREEVQQVQLRFRGQEMLEVPVRSGAKVFYAPRSSQ